MNALEPKSLGLVFDRQPRESSKAFAAFQTYVELGLERSHAAVAEKYGTSRRMIHKWAKKFGWTERIAARGAHLVGAALGGIGTRMVVHHHGRTARAQRYRARPADTARRAGDERGAAPPEVGHGTER